MKNEYLEGGRIATAHGVRGLVKVNHSCDSAEVLASVSRVYIKKGSDYAERKVIHASVAGAQALMEIEGISSREEAIALRGEILYLAREDVPLAEGAMFIADMLGLPVYHAESGRELGVITDVSDIAGRRIFTVKHNGKDVLLPDVPEFIKEISEERGMSVLPIPGFFDEEDEV